MSRRRASRAAAIALAVLALPVPAVAAEPTALGVDAVVERHLAARGGAERWRALEALELRGQLSAFSVRRPFVLRQARGNRFRLDFEMNGHPTTYAADAQGPWWIYPMLGVETASRVDDLRYSIQLSRLSRLEPLLLDAEAKGLRVALLGPGEVDGVATVDLEVVLPGAPDDTPAIALHRREVWHLDATTFLEVAIDTTVTDFTQGIDDEQARKPQRSYFSDFRAFAGLVIPCRVDVEFGARLESTTVESVVVDPPLAAADFAMPEPPATAAPSPSGG